MKTTTATEVLNNLKAGTKVYQGVWVGNENFILGGTLNIGDLEFADLQKEAEKQGLYVDDISTECDCNKFDCSQCGSQSYEIGVFENSPIN